MASETSHVEDCLITALVKLSLNLSKMGFMSARNDFGRSDEVDFKALMWLRRVARSVGWQIH